MSRREKETRCIVGNRRNFIVVGHRGEVLWCRSPWMDSPSIFSRLLHDHHGGTFKATPTLPFESTLEWTGEHSVAETRMETVAGKGRIRDESLTLHGGFPLPLFSRKIETLSGQIDWEIEIEPRFDFGLREATLEKQENLHLFRDSSLEEQEWNSSNYWVFLIPELKGTGDPSALKHREESKLYKEKFTLSLNTTSSPSLEILWGHGRESLYILRKIQRGEAQRSTLEGWRGNLLSRSRSRLTSDPFPGAWNSAAHRCLRVLEVLSTFENDNLIGAPSAHSHHSARTRNSSTQTPVWINDLCRSLLLWTRVPLSSELQRWKWQTLQSILRYLKRASPDQISAHFPIDETQSESERILSRSLRLDAHGWILHSLLQTYLATKEPESTSFNPQTAILAHWPEAVEITEWLCRAWRRPDLGVRTGAQRPSHFTSSKAMAWFGIQSAIRLNDLLGLPRQKKWETEAHLLHATICTQGVDRSGEFFTLEFGSSEIDLSVLVLFQIEFLPPSDPRLLATLDRIQQQHLFENRLYLEPVQSAPGAGRPPQLRENSPRGCIDWSFQFWFLNALSYLGKTEEAQKILDRVLDELPSQFLLGDRWNPDTRESEGEWPSPRSQVEFLHTLIEVQEGRSGKIPSSPEGQK